MFTPAGGDSVLAQKFSATQIASNARFPFTPASAGEGRNRTIGVHGTRRLLFAKQLLTETGLPITEVALAAGFNSVRRFNAVFQDAYRMPPRDLRKAPRASSGDALTLRLAYRPPYDLPAMLDFLRGRALPGIEVVDEVAYTRVIGTAAAPGWLDMTLG